MQQDKNINQPLEPLAESTEEASAAAEEDGASATPVVSPSASPKPLTRLPSITGGSGSTGASAVNTNNVTRRPPATIPSLGTTGSSNRTTPRPVPGNNVPLRQGVPNIGSTGTIPAPGGTAAGNNANTTSTGNAGSQNGIPDIAGLLAAAGGKAAGADAEVPNMHTFNFPAMPLEPIFTIYSELTGKMVLYAPTLEGTVNLVTAAGVELTTEEAIEAITTSLALANVVMVPMGEKFVKAVPKEEAMQHAPEATSEDASQIPDSGMFLTRTIKLNSSAPSEVAEILAPMSANPDGLIPIDSTQILIIHDYAVNIKQMLQVIEKIDIEPELDYSLEVIPIRYGKVGELYNTMAALISGGGAAAGTGTGAGNTGSGFNSVVGSIPDSAVAWVDLGVDWEVVRHRLAGHPWEVLEGATEAVSGVVLVAAIAPSRPPLRLPSIAVPPPAIAAVSRTGCARSSIVRRMAKRKSNCWPTPALSRTNDPIRF